MDPPATAEEAMETLRKHFDEADEDNSGTLERDELATILKQ